MAAVMMVVLASLMFMVLGGIEWCSVLGFAKGRMNNEAAVLESD